MPKTCKTCLTASFFSEAVTSNATFIAAFSEGCLFECRIYSAQFEMASDSVDGTNHFPFAEGRSKKGGNQVSQKYFKF